MAASASHVVRVTMFKLPRDEDKKKLVHFYEELKTEQAKDGKPYILSLEAGPLAADSRSQGFTFICKTVFKDMADHDFYDKECEAHKALKAKIIGAPDITVDSVMTVFYEPTVIGGL